MCWLPHPVMQEGCSLPIGNVADSVSDLRHRTQKKNLTEEERESQAQTLYSEFLSAHDHGEALTLARELAAPGTLRPSHHHAINALLHPLTS